MKIIKNILLKIKSIFKKGKCTNKCKKNACKTEKVINMADKKAKKKTTKKTEKKVETSVSETKKPVAPKRKKP